MKKGFIKQNVGIDISQDDFKVNLSMMSTEFNIVVKGSKSIDNNEEGFAVFKTWFSDKSLKEMELHFTMEATGVYYENLAYFLRKQGYVVHVVLPNQAKKYGQSLGIKSKTDKIDARTLAQMGLERKLQNWEPFSANFQMLKRLTRERDALIEERTVALNQLHAYEHEGHPVQATIRRSHEHIDFLEKQVNEIEQEIEKIVEEDKALKERLNYVLSIKGVGLITAVTVVSETNGFAAISNIKQLISYAGLDVKLRESGKWKGKAKISKKGNKYIRKILYFPAFSYIQHNSRVKEKYQRLKDKKAIPMVAAVAQQRKLLGLIYSLWKKQEMYLPAA